MDADGASRRGWRLLCDRHYSGFGSTLVVVAAGQQLPHGAV
jgi:hypothetical protein